MVFIIEKTKETVQDFSRGALNVLLNESEWFNCYHYKMTECNNLKVKLSNSHLNKLMSAIKNEIEVVLKLKSNMVDNSDDGTNFPHRYHY